MSGVFQFKQFGVDQSGCAMKINTDGVLLGALIQSSHPKTILDIGTGTGVISLMAAQRFSNAAIEAVEIDELAAATAEMNFRSSPFADRLSVYSASFQAFFQLHPEKKYDLILSNPPFYINTLPSSGEGKNLAKHTNADFFQGLILQLTNHLTIDGLFWVILPIDTSILVKQLVSSTNLRLNQVINIKSYPDSTPHREILAFGLKNDTVIERDFVIYQSFKEYSGQYQTALRDFFTIFP